jgi:hypothetical protein
MSEKIDPKGEGERFYLTTPIYYVNDVRFDPP